MNDDSVVLKATPVLGSYPPVLLASQSEIRRHLLQAAGIAVRVRSSGVDEDMIKRMCREQGAGVDETACALAEAKARAVASSDGTLVIGADQILALGEQRFDKPADRAQARRHLLALRGRTHHLHTAIVVCRGTDVLWRHVARPSLRMRSFSDACLDAYLAMEGDAVLASVGAYRLEGPGVHLFEAIEGDHSAILGLPMLPLLAALRDLHAAPI